MEELSNQQNPKLLTFRITRLSKMGYNAKTKKRLLDQRANAGLPNSLGLKMKLRI